MAESAQVKSLDALRDVRDAVVEYQDITRAALGEANGQVQRTINWLENDATAYWKQQIKKQNNRVSQAKAELQRAQLSASMEGSSRSIITEKKALEREQKRLEYCEQKLQNIKRWLREFDRAVFKFRGQIQQLDNMVEGETPKAIARLDQMYTSLEKYIRMRAPEVSESTGRSSGASEALPEQDEARPAADASADEQDNGPGGSA
jgi:DNA repair exonuclease SbcCD ATPase subunit